MDAYTTHPPTPTRIHDLARVEHTRLRRRMLYSSYEADLDAMLRQALGNVRADAWKPVDLTANPYLSLWQQVAVLYNEAPDVRVRPGDEGLLEAVADAALWPLMQRVQRDVLGLREMLLRVEVDAAGVVVVRPVFPDLVEAWGKVGHPSVLARVREAVLEPVFGWVWHDLDITDPASPSYTVVTPAGIDVTMDVLGAGYSGEAYPYRKADGTPILPYVLYHAAETGFLFDPYTMREIVSGSLTLGVYLTYFGHVLRNAAWAQRYAIGAEPAGAETPDGDGGSRREVVSDPATLLILRPDPSMSGQATVGQWTSPADPEALLRSVAMYEKRILTLAGLQPPDVTRQEADIRSGYSLAVARDSVREFQRTFEPQFRKGDGLTLALIATLLNRATGTSYSEEPRDYRVQYRGLPRSPAEQAAQLTELSARMAAGLVGPVSAYMEIHPGVMRDEALAAIAHGRLEEAEVAALVASLSGTFTPQEGAALV